MILKPQSAKYIVRSGDNLTSIAKAHNLPSWKVIADYPENAKLFNIHRSPDDLQIGDQLIIPPNPIQLLEYHISILTKIKEDNVKHCDELIAVLTADHRKFRQFLTKIDIIAAVAQLGVGYGKIVKGGVDAMKLSGKELAKANAKLGKDAILNAPAFATPLTLQHTSVLDITGEESLAIAIPKVLLKAWFDMTSPSFWAQKISGVDFDKEFNDSIRHLTCLKQETTYSINLKIEEFRKMILQHRNP